MSVINGLYFEQLLIHGSSQCAIQWTYNMCKAIKEVSSSKSIYYILKKKGRTLLHGLLADYIMGDLNLVYLTCEPYQEYLCCILCNYGITYLEYF